MNDWIELKINNIPEDILDSEKYEYMIPEEIMSNWFKSKNKERTRRQREMVASYTSIYTDPYYIFSVWSEKEYFNDLEMAKIPPEN